MRNITSSNDIRYQVEIRKSDLPPPTQREFSNAGLSSAEHGRTGGVVGRYAATTFPLYTRDPPLKNPV